MSLKEKEGEMADMQAAMAKLVAHKARKLGLISRGIVKEIKVDETKTQKEHFLSVGIDFGTTFSGYAYSFSFSPDKIHTNDNWGSNSGAQSLKAPTVILFDASKKFHSFGYKAEDKYSQLVGTPEEKTWYYFHRFKMMLMSSNFCSFQSL